MSQIAGPVRIFVGCDPNDCDLEQMMVLDHTLHQHASLPLEIHWMRLSRDPASPWYSDPATGAGWQTQRWATPFSGFRWAVPAVAGGVGRAIYMDTDIIALGDVAALWRLPIDAPAVVLARQTQAGLRFCVSLWDCARAGALLPPLAELQRNPQAHADCARLFARRSELTAPLDAAWNNIDGEGQPPERIALLHYSDMGLQFSHPRALARLAREGRTHWFDGRIDDHPRRDLAALFEDSYAAALAAGRSLDDYRNPAPFGAVAKKSERGYKGNPITRPRLPGVLRWLGADRR